MDANALLLSVVSLGLQGRAVTRPPPTSLFFGGGRDAILPCADASPACADVSWFYTIEDTYVTAVDNGRVASRSAPRLSLDAECSLVIKNVTAEDAGSFACRPGNDPQRDEFMFLNVLTISPSPPYEDPDRAGDVTLECSLWGHPALRCPPHSLRWVDGAGARLQDEGVGHRVLGQATCVSVLTVKRQSAVDRRYACLFGEGNRVAVEAGYTAHFTDDPVDHTITIISVVSVIGAVVVVVVMAAVLIKYRKRAKVTEDVLKLTQQSEEAESHVTYVTVVHARQQAPPYTHVREEAVTYSTVSDALRTEADEPTAPSAK